MKYSLLLVPFLVSPACAQEDLWKSLAKGDRIQVTFRSGNTIQGTLDNKPADPRVPPGPIDYTTVSEITLDLSYEYPGVNGTMTIPRKDIKEIRKIQNMDPTTLRRIQEELKRIQARTAADEAKRRAEEADRDKLAKAEYQKALKEQAAADRDKKKGQKLLDEFSDLQKGKELLKRFPPDKYGPQTLKDAVDMAIRKQPVPPDYQAFADTETQRLWNLAVQAQQAEASQSASPDKSAPDSSSTGGTTGTSSPGTPGTNPGTKPQNQ